MKKLTLDFTPEELGILTTMASDQLFRKQCIDSKMPGYRPNREELDLCTRLRDAGWRVLATPEFEVLHVGGVSTGRSRRTHLMHSDSVYRYYRKHRATGWRRSTLPVAWAALRTRAELVGLRERVAAHRDEERAS